MGYQYFDYHGVWTCYLQMECAAHLDDVATKSLSLTTLWSKVENSSKTIKFYSGQHLKLVIKLSNWSSEHTLGLGRLRGLWAVHQLDYMSHLDQKPIGNSTVWPLLKCQWVRKSATLCNFRFLRLWITSGRLYPFWIDGKKNIHLGSQREIGNFGKQAVAKFGGRFELGLPAILVSGPTNETLKQ